MKNIARYLVEVRFDPSPFILDKRGAIAESISNQSKFSGWEISNNRIDFEDTEKKISAFLSYKNLGIVIPESEDGNLDPRPAQDFIKSAWSFFPSDKIIRFGIRTLSFTERRSFDRIFTKFRNKFLKISDDSAQLMGGEIVDVGFPIHFQVGNIKYNINTGPMKKEQAMQFFAVPETEMPDAGIFLDCDYFTEGFDHIPKQREMLELVQSGLNKAKESQKAIEELLK